MPLPPAAVPLQYAVTPLHRAVMPLRADVTPLRATVTPLRREVIRLPRGVMAFPLEVIALPRHVMALPHDVMPLPRIVKPLPRKGIELPRAGIGSNSRASAPRRPACYTPREIFACGPLDLFLRTPHKQLEQLKESLRQGDISTALEYLENISNAQDLDNVREQKLLLGVRDQEKQLELVTAYKLAAKRLHSSKEEIDKAERYADFTNILLGAFEKLTVQAGGFRHIFTFLSPLELVELAHEATQEIMAHASESHWAELERETGTNTLSSSEWAALSEWTTHRMHGSVNDIGFASARTVNWLMQFTDPLKKNTNKRTRSEAQERLYSLSKESLHALFQIAGNWNSLEYAADKVSYGDWVITDIRQTGSIEVEFTFADISLAQANEIGHRREIISLYRGRDKPRWMREFLEGFALSATRAALNFYASSSYPRSLAAKTFTELKPIVLKLLDPLGAEDELLLAAAKDDFSVLAQYLATIALFCFTTTALLIKERSKSINKRLTCPIIPIEKLVSLVAGKDQSRRSLAREAVSSQLLQLPTLRYLDICQTPYIRLPANQVVALATYSNGNWPPVVRSALVKGGLLAKTYGDIWEEFIKHSLTGFGWKILERGGEIKRNNKTLTDIDVIAFKDGLLLLIQVKAIAGTAFNIYDYWKAKKTIIKGTEQALIAEQEINNNPSLLSSMLSTNRATEKVERIQPFVLTTIPQFTGWKYNGVPVVGSGYLMSLLRGAQVTYLRGDGSIVGGKQFIKGNELTSDEFIEYLHNPWDWQISKETSSVDQMWVDLHSINMKLAFPVLKRDRALT